VYRFLRAELSAQSLITKNKEHMRSKLKLLTLMSVLCTATIYANDCIKLQQGKPTPTENEYLYEIKDSEVLVNDKLITLFAFSQGGISASYRNKTYEKKSPKYTFKVYNSYGMLMGSKKLGDEGISVFGRSASMEPGAVDSEKIYLKPFPLDEILKHANVEIPPDFLEMKWVVISETNSK
jgi:hypothetical protein